MVTAPKSIRLTSDRIVLNLSFLQETIALSSEYLRVYSPTQEREDKQSDVVKFPPAKKKVYIEDIQLVGHYGMQIIFSDKHSTGIYRWDYLLLLAREYEQRWQAYLNYLQQHKLYREEGEQKVKFV